MVSEFTEIKDAFSELKDFILNDVKIISESPVGGNYAATLVITTACEVLGPLRFENSGEKNFFKEYLTPDKWKPVSFSIYDALRNGLAHSFSPKAIVNVGNKSIEIGVSWREMPHFELDEAKSILFINVKKLSDNLYLALGKYEKELESSAELCNRFKVKRNKKRSVHVQSQEELKSWSAILGE